MRGLLAAASLLTRVPVPRHPGNDEELARAVPWFPVVGAVIGVATAAVYAGGHWLVGPLAAAVLALAAQVLLTGAFHEDGLADLADSAGGRDRQDRLRILHDPGHGTYGVVALLLSVLARTAAIASLTPLRALAALVAAHALGRGGAVALMGLMAPATRYGLGAGHQGRLRGRQVVSGVVSALVIAAVASRLVVVPEVAAAAIAAAAVGLYSRRSLGGITGDSLGAAEQVAETAVLLVAAGIGQK